MISQRLRHALLFIGCTFPVAVSAQGFVDRVQGGASAVAGQAGLNQTGNLETIIGNVIGVALSFVGVILLVVLLYAGFLWLTAGGDETKVKKARGMIRDGVIGLIILVSAYALVNFVLSSLAGATTGVTGTGGVAPSP